ncbi:MAG: enoyl-CoA hydratase-related protein [Caulobacterales bacterium]|nr:enoyl-CoA hydratase-related protein [Caulobacterales bacterium]
MTFAYLTYDVDQHVATITLNRPDKLNALNAALRGELLQAIEQAGGSEEVRAVVITGAGRGFCSGGDMQEKMEAVKRGEGPTARDKIDPIRNRIILAMRAMGKPLIAAVNGAAAGGGMNIALACDIRIASTNATFSQSFAKRGMHPDWGGTYFLPRLVGYAAACELIWSGRRVDAREALALGLVTRLEEPETLTPAAHAMARAIAEGPPIAIRLAKQAVGRALDTTLAEALDFESYAQMICAETDDIKEGVSAFIEKRKPRFTGR